MDRHQIRNANELGGSIRQRRKALQLTQQDLAAVARVTPRVLGEVEKGKETAQLGGVLRILAALGLDLYARPR